MKNKIFISFLFCAISLVGYSQSWLNYNDTNGLVGNQSTAVICDKHNNIWVKQDAGANGKGLDKFDGTSWTNYATSNSGLPHDRISSMAADTSGNLWVGFLSQNTAFAKFDGLNWTVYNTSNSGIISNDVWGINCDKNNNIWLSCSGGLSKFDGTTFTNYPYSASGAVFAQDSANIWVANIGLDRFNPITGIWKHFDPSNSGLPGYNVSSVTADTNGILWVGFLFGFNGGPGTGGSNGGLCTFDGTTFTPIWPFQNTYTGVYGLNIDRTNNVWVSTRCEGLYKFDGSIWTNISGVPLNGCSFSVTSDQQNNTWFAEVYSGVWTNSGPVEVTQANPRQSMKLFPNPTNSTINVSLQKCTMISVYNALGEILIENEFPSIPNRQMELDVSFLPSGIYSIKAGDQFGKFVRE